MIKLPKIISISSRVHEELNIIEAMDNKLNFSLSLGKLYQQRLMGSSEKVVHTI